MNMSSYLLLRDNKQTGPYTLDELITKGLKPYALIWIEGRSAGWRYPSEVPELIAYAPAVEEQPYDRFYKKPSNTQTKTEPRSEPAIAEIASMPVEIKNEPVFVKPLPKEENNVNLPNRKVYVNLPATVAKRSNPRTPDGQSNGEEKPTIEKKPVIEKPAVEQAPIVEKQNAPARKDEKEFERYLPADPAKPKQQAVESEAGNSSIQPQKFSTAAFEKKETNGNGNHTNARLSDGQGDHYSTHPQKN